MRLTVCILAGGEGKRMKSNLPKVLHLFKHKPMIVHIIEKSLELNTEKIIIITGKHNNLIQKTIKEFINNDQFNKLSFVIQHNPMGTGHAVSCTLNEYVNNESVLILNGDTPNLTKELLFKFIQNHNNKILISEIDDPTGYGRIILNNQNNIVKIVEEKDTNTQERLVKLINSGIYFIESKNLIKYIPLIKNKNIQSEYYLTDIIELMILDNIDIKGHLINKDENQLILGVNTAEQLHNLEKL